MLEIAERILAALIILALLTLLIILAFPVPPRPDVGQAPNPQTAQQQPEPKDGGNKPAPPAPAPAPAPASTGKKEDPPAPAPAPAPASGGSSVGPSKTLPPKDQTSRLAEGEPSPPRFVGETHANTARKRNPLRQQRSRVVVDCAEYDCDCGPRRPQRRRRYRAEATGPRLVERHDVPYWVHRLELADRAEPGPRPYWAQIPPPPGTCPE